MFSTPYLAGLGEALTEQLKRVAESGRHSHFVHIFYPLHWTSNQLDMWIKVIQPQIEEQASQESCSQIHLEKF